MKVFLAFLVVLLLTETSFSEFTDFESGMLGQLLYYEEKNPPFKDKRNDHSKGASHNTQNAIHFFKFAFPIISNYYLITYILKYNW